MSKYNEHEYLDALVTIELAVAIAEKYKNNANQTIRATWRAIRPRITNELNRKIFDGLAKQIFARGALAMMRRQLDEAVSE